MEDSTFTPETGYFKLKSLLEDISFQINRLFRNLEERRTEILPELFQELRNSEVNYQQELEFEDHEMAAYYLKEIEERLNGIDSTLKQMEKWIGELEELLEKKEELIRLYAKRRKHLPEVEEGGWTSQVLVEALGPECAGLCNAMSTAWQLEVLVPKEGTTGMDHETLDMMINLKIVLDYVVQFYHDVSSVQISRYFMTFVEEGDQREILEMLKTFEGREALAEQFEKYVRNKRGTLEMTNGHTELLSFEELTSAGHLCPHLEEGIGTLDISSNCFLIFSMKFYHDSEFRGGHEFSVKYNAETQVLEIYDQNFGLKRFEGIDTLEALILKMAEVIHYYYIEHPIGDSNTFQIFLLR